MYIHDLTQSQDDNESSSNSEESESGEGEDVRSGPGSTALPVSDPVPMSPPAPPIEIVTPQPKPTVPAETTPSPVSVPTGGMIFILIKLACVISH